MRIGAMIGPERGRYATKVDRLRADARWAEEAGPGDRVDPPDPRRVRRPDRRRAGRRGDGPHRDRHRRRPRPAPAPDRPGAAGPLGPGRVRRPAHPGPRRVAPLDRRRDARAALRAPRHHHARPPRRARPGPRRDRARSTSRTSCSGCTTRSTSPTSRRPRCCSPPWARRCCGWPASAPTARSCGWPTSGPSPPTSPPASPRRPRPPAGRRPASWPASRCACAATTRSTPRSSAPTASCPRPRCRPTTSGCSTWATPATSATSSPPAARRPSRSASGPSPTPAPPTSRCGSSPSATGRDELLASLRRTRDLLASLAESL